MPEHLCHTRPRQMNAEPKSKRRATNGNRYVQSNPSGPRLNARSHSGFARKDVPGGAQGRSVGKEKIDGGTVTWGGHVGGPPSESIKHPAEGSQGMGLGDGLIHVRESRDHRSLDSRRMGSKGERREEGMMTEHLCPIVG